MFDNKEKQRSNTTTKQTRTCFLLCGVVALTVRCLSTCVSQEVFSGWESWGHSFDRQFAVWAHLEEMGPVAFCSWSRPQRGRNQYNEKAWLVWQSHLANKTSFLIPATFQDHFLYKYLSHNSWLVPWSQPVLFIHSLADTVMKLSLFFLLSYVQYVSMALKHFGASSEWSHKIFQIEKKY